MSQFRTYFYWKLGLKGVLDCSNLRSACKSVKEKGTASRFKRHFPEDVTSDVVQCRPCSELYYGKFLKHLSVRIKEHVGN